MQEHSLLFTRYFIYVMKNLFFGLQVNVHVWKMVLVSDEWGQWKKLQVNQRWWMKSCSPRLHHHWSRPIEHHSEISLSHLFRTTVPLILFCFCLYHQQLTLYVASVSARFSQVTDLGDKWPTFLTALAKKKKNKTPEKQPLTRQVCM